MEKIVLEIEAYPKLDVEIKTFAQESVKVGRSFDNDLILLDPHVSALHLTLIQRNGLFFIQNHSMINGTYVANKDQYKRRVKVESEFQLSSGMVIFIGKSQIRFWLVNEPIKPEVSLETNEVIAPTQKFTSIISLFICLALFTLFEAFNFYIALWDNKNFLYSFLLKYIGFLIIFVLWAGFWSVINKFIKKKASFLEHLSATLRWNVMIKVAEGLKYVFCFFFCNRTFDFVLTQALTLAFIFYILNVHLRIATNLRRKNRILIPLAFVLVFLLITLLTYFKSEHVFSAYYKHYFNLLPVPSGLIPTLSIEQYFQKIQSIY